MKCGLVPALVEPAPAVARAKPISVRNRLVYLGRPQIFELTWTFLPWSIRSSTRRGITIRNRLTIKCRYMCRRTRFNIESSRPC